MEQSTQPFDLPNGFEDEAVLLYQAWVVEVAGLRNASKQAFFQQCHEDIQVILAYTQLLKDASGENPFQRSLNFPLHPRMILI